MRKKYEAVLSLVSMSVYSGDNPEHLDAAIESIVQNIAG